MPFVTYGYENALLCQRLDENARSLERILDAPFHVLHLEGLAAFFGWQANCFVSFRKIWPKPKKGSGMTKKVADLLMGVLAETNLFSCSLTCGLRTNLFARANAIVDERQ
jgi:hypothetical protein